MKSKITLNIILVCVRLSVPTLIDEKVAPRVHVTKCHASLSPN